ncbi:MAG: SpoIID/LytB domain-containing protein [Balneolales bacterium]|nr:SpoIID/LytB domain-containing protein [Balneolales bacterium]
MDSFKLFPLLLLLLAGCSLETSDISLFDAEPDVRVRIIEGANELTLNSESTIRARLSDRDASLSPPVTISVINRNNNPLMQISTTDGDQYLTSELLLSPTSVFTIENVPYGVGWWWGGVETRSYEGQLHVYIDSLNAIDAVLNLPMEEYLKGVIPYEIGPASPLEALKAQAIAARSEIVQTMITGKYRGEFHDVCADVECQVFAGNIRRSERSDSAVTLTR